MTLWNNRSGHSHKLTLLPFCHVLPQNINEVLADVDRIKTNLKSIAVNTTAIKDEFLKTLTNSGDACIANSNQTEGIDELVTTLQSTLTAAGDLTYENSDAFDDTIDELMSSTDQVTEAADNIELGDWQALVILIPYILVPFFLLVGVILAWLKVDIPQIRCVLSYFILPLFIFLVVFAFSFASAVLIAASGNADFCSGGEEQNPDMTMIEIFQEMGHDQDTLLFKAVKYYVGQCVSDDPFPFISNYSEELRNIRENVTSFVAVTAALVNTTLQAACVDDVELLNTLAGELADNLQILVRSAMEALALLRCENIVKLYTDPVYSGTCTYSINGVTWAFASFTMVGIAGLIMIMLRSSWQLDVAPDFVFDGRTSGVGNGQGDYNEGEQQQDGDNYNGGDQDNKYAAEREYAPDTSTIGGDEQPYHDDDWLQNEFTVPADVHLDDNDTFATTDGASMAGSRKPQHYASPY